MEAPFEGSKTYLESGENGPTLFPEHWTSDKEAHAFQDSLEKGTCRTCELEGKTTFTQPEDARESFGFCTDRHAEQYSVLCKEHGCDWLQGEKVDPLYGALVEKKQDELARKYDTMRSVISSQCRRYGWTCQDLDRILQLTREYGGTVEGYAQQCEQETISPEELTMRLEVEQPTSLPKAA